MKDNQSKTVRIYRVGKLTILQIMGILASAGLLATWMLHQFFG